MTAPKIVLRAEAKAKGLKHYFTGKPCVRNHIDYRFTSIGKCMACAREDSMSAHVFITGRKRSYTGGKEFIHLVSGLNPALDYSEVEYVSPHTPVKIVCPKHGPFMMSPTNHLQGKGCKYCWYERGEVFQRKDLDDFIREARGVHGTAFDYSEVVYRGAKTPVQIRCLKHPEKTFSQQPSNHLQGQNPCKKCNTRKSRPQEELTAFVAMFSPVASDAVGVINGKNELDIYIPTKNLAVEFHGMRFHTHWSIESEDKNKHKTADKYRECAKKSIRLITIFEYEWSTRKRQIKRLLRNALGKSKGKVMARKCDLRKVPTKQAHEFFDMYHPQGGVGGGEHYGLFWKDKLVACMRFTFGANDRGLSERVWTLSRYATRVSVTGGASRLFKTFIAEFDPPEVKSFSDNRYFAGGMYLQLGFVKEEGDEEIPDYQVWSQKIGLKPKSHYQRRAIPKRLKDHNLDIKFDPDKEKDPRTEREMTYLMGAGRIYDCGKKKWVWRKP